MLLTRCDKHIFLTARCLGDGAPRRGPTAEGAGELLRIRAETVAEQMGGTESILVDGGARACNDGSGSIESMIVGTGSALEFKSDSRRAYNVTSGLRRQHQYQDNGASTRIQIRLTTNPRDVSARLGPKAATLA
jgi:hypothetical protein